MTEKPLLRIESLTKAFGGIRAIDKFSLLVGPEEIVAIIGPNGSGKTTLFNLIVHLYESDSGAIYFGSSLIDLTHIATHNINAAGVARTFQNLKTISRISP